MRRRSLKLLTLAFLGAVLCACGGTGGRAHSAAFPSAPAPPGVSTASYEIAFDEAKGELAVIAALPAGLAASLDVDEAAATYIEGVDVEHDGHHRVVSRSASGFLVPECKRAACTVRYRVMLRNACTRLSDVDTASLDDDVLEAPPPTWILAPWDAPPPTKVRFRVHTSDKVTFVTGVFPAHDQGESKEAARATVYETTVADLSSAPYSVFGALRTMTVDTTGGKLVVAIAPGALTLTDAQLSHWIDTAARAVSSYYGSSPIAREAVLLFPGRGGGVGFGKSLVGGGASVLVRVGRRATAPDLEEDWVLTHELVHAAFPAQPRTLDWVEEGLATYVEPLARARIGTLTDEEVWRGFIKGFPNGTPEDGDRGIDRTHTWGRTYWGGALFFFLADLQIRRDTQGKLSLREALTAILHEAGNNTARTPLDEALAVGDKSTGTTVLTKLHAAWAETPVPVDLHAVFARLGVSLGADGEKVIFDDAAPEAGIRKSFTARAP
jgi:hypothetical protein